MDLSRVIIGQIVTEKSESLKTNAKTFTVQVSPQATKIDVKKAFKQFYDVDVLSVRIINTVPKTRNTGRGQMEKRHRAKKALVALSEKSKNFDLASFKS